MEIKPSATSPSTAGHDHHDHHGHVCWGAGHAGHSEHTLTVSGIEVRYGEVLALQDVAFDTRCGRSLALLGPNGAGKSSLIKVLAGILKPGAGTIRWRGAPLTAAHRELAYLPQRGEVDWAFPITVEGLVQMGRYPHVGLWKRFGPHDHGIVTRALDAMKLTDLAQRQIGALSGGQQQRAFIARALAQEAHVLLFDEPFTGLDQPAQEMLRQLFRDLTSEGRLLIASHHDLDSVPGIFDEVLLLQRRQIAFGPVAEAFTPENVAATFYS